ncbi:hypothetical protein AAFF_G00339980, partial [Aldrovandia affinis]
WPRTCWALWQGQHTLRIHPLQASPQIYARRLGRRWGGAGALWGQWEQDDGDMWNSPTSQESSSSCSSWGNPPKKGPQKGKTPSKQADVWIMNRLIKQLTDMGFPRDPAEEALKSNNMNLDQAMSALLEKKTELDKRGMGISDYNNGLANKPMGCRLPALSKESSSDRAPFLDKGGMFVSSGAAQARAMQQQQAPPPQPPVPLSSSQPSLRAQVPQFLSPQVQAQLLQFAAKNIGLNPALLTSPISPQHMTLLNQLYQLQLAYQRLQLQQQMLQAQRNVSGPIRQQEQQVARTINNMQQQIQQHQRQLVQALLLKQQPPPHSSLHPNAGKSALDSFPTHPQAPGLSDLQTKEPQSSPNSYAPYPLSGLNPNMNVNSMEVGGLSMKEPPQPQSRLSQWTHPNSMETLTGSSSPLEANLSKHGAITASPNLGPPGKTPLDDSYSPYNLISSSESPASPLVTPDSWGQGKSANDKISNGTNINWPPEFCPGVPWKGLQNIDPETDPNMTPGSVPSGPTINTNIQDVNRYLLRDRSAGKMADMKSTWSPSPVSHSQASLSHELWKVPQGARNSTAPPRPPPGLTNTKPSSTWGGNTLGLAPTWSSSYSSGTTWSTDSSSRTSSWLVLRNLTPQIDGSTLRTLCMQHGPLLTFHLNLTQGNAVVRYSSKEEAAKAQKSLHMCVLGNTTILAEFAGEEEVNRFFAQGQSLAATPTTSWQSNPGTNHTRLGGGAGAGPSHPMGHHWSGAGGTAKAGGDLLWGGVQQYSSLWGPPGGGEDGRGVIGSPTPINTLLPGDLLRGESIQSDVSVLQARPRQRASVPPAYLPLGWACRAAAVLAVMELDHRAVRVHWSAAPVWPSYQAGRGREARRRSKLVVARSTQADDDQEEQTHSCGDGEQQGGARDAHVEQARAQLPADADAAAVRAVLRHLTICVHEYHLRLGQRIPALQIISTDDSSGFFRRNSTTDAFTCSSTDSCRLTLPPPPEADSQMPPPIGADDQGRSGRDAATIRNPTASYQPWPGGGKVSRHELAKKCEGRPCKVAAQHQYRPPCDITGGRIPMGGRGGPPWYGGTMGGPCPYGGIPPGMYPGIAWGGPPY